MCGIAGFVDTAPSAQEAARAVLTSMTDAIAHRGPDGDGHWFSDDGRVAFGHRRLAIIDLSDTGHQPMASHSGRYVITFNGEIYGFQNLRADLHDRGVQFKGTSDTEVLLAMFEAFGIEDALPRINGMFAFAVIDQKDRTVVFARDRLGKKPLYIGLQQNVVVFGSELKCLRAHPAFSTAEVNRDALALYMRHGYIPAPHTIYANVFKLPAGSSVAVPLERFPSQARDMLENTSRYWSMFDVAEQASSERQDDEISSLDRLDDLLMSAVEERLISDVPVGAFLSGGIDSSLITAMMQETSPKPVRTFTVRFDDQRLNEADFAAETASHLKTDHCELLATPQMALDLVDDMPRIFDEPFADSSQIPTVLVSQLASKEVKVALSGDGGDESFCGYERYSRMRTFNRMGRKLPGPAWKTMAAMPVGFLNAGVRLGRPLLPGSFRAEASGDRMKKLAGIMRHSDKDQRYFEFISQWSSPETVVKDSDEPSSAIGSNFVPSTLDCQDRMMFRDTIQYLPDDILVKVDRASMAFGLEMRAPLLDHRVVAAAWRMPRSLCVSGDEKKVALRRLLAKRLPEKLYDRPKQGFGIPVHDWLRGPLRDWANDLLSTSRLQSGGFFDTNRIQTCWQEHCSGRRNWGERLWTVLMFQTWAARWDVGQ